MKIKSFFGIVVKITVSILAIIPAFLISFLYEYTAYYLSTGSTDLGARSPAYLISVTAGMFVTIHPLLIAIWTRRSRKLRTIAGFVSSIVGVFIYHMSAYIFFWAIAPLMMKTSIFSGESFINFSIIFRVSIGCYCAKIIYYRIAKEKNLANSTDNKTRA
jgi:hypothetical protein